MMMVNCKDHHHHHHHQWVPTTQFPLILSLSLSLAASVLIGHFPKWVLYTAPNVCKELMTISLCLSINTGVSLMSSSLLLQQYPASLPHLSWIICEMWGKWSYNCCFVGCCIQDLFKTASRILMYFPSTFFFIRI